MKMMMIMVIILMFDYDNAQKSSTTMTLWSKYSPFKYYYLVKKKDQTNRAGANPPPQTGDARLKTFFSMDAFPKLSCGKGPPLPLSLSCLRFNLISKVTIQVCFL